MSRALRLPAVRDRLAERILPEADLHRVLSLEPQIRNRAVLTLLYASGVRVSVLCALSWRDLQPNGDGGQITVLGKGGVTRAVQIPASVWKLVSGLRTDKAGPDDPVFRSRKVKNGGRLRPLAVLRIVRKAASRAGHRSACLAPLVPPRPRLPCPRPRPPSTSSRPPSATQESEPPAATSTPAPAKARGDSSRSDRFGPQAITCRRQGSGARKPRSEAPPPSGPESPLAISPQEITLSTTMGTGKRRNVDVNDNDDQLLALARSALLQSECKAGLKFLIGRQSTTLFWCDLKKVLYDPDVSDPVDDEELSRAVRDDEWAVIGTILSDSKSKAVSGFWGLAQIPYLGQLFKQTSTDTEDSDVLIGVRTHLLTSPPDQIVTKRLRVGSDARPFNPH